MNKRLLALLLALAMTAALAACGGKQAPETEEDVQTEAPETEAQRPEDGGEDAAAADDGAPAPSAPEVEVGSHPADPEEKPEVGNRPADPEEKPEVGSRPADPAQKPEPQPAEKPVEKPEESQSKPAPSADLAAFYETLAADEDWPAMMLAEGEVLDAFYPGLSEITTNQCLVYTSMISATVGEIALVEVQNGDDVQKVKDIFQARIDYQVGDDTQPGGAWYPETIEGWKNGSRIVSNGNFVLLAATYEKSDDIAAAFNALFQ